MNQNYDKIWKKLDIGCMFSLKKKQLTLRNTRQQCAYDAILSTYTGMTYELSLLLSYYTVQLQALCVH